MPPNVKQRKNPVEDAFAKGYPIDDALNRGIQEAMLVHEKLGQSIVVWRGGKAVWLPADQIAVSAPRRRRTRSRKRRTS
jgi:hypothetical protein